MPGEQRPLLCPGRLEPGLDLREPFSGRIGVRASRWSGRKRPRASMAFAVAFTMAFTAACCQLLLQSCHTEGNQGPSQLSPPASPIPEPGRPALSGGVAGQRDQGRGAGPGPAWKSHPGATPPLPC